jgi:beta-phosphoglucomutase family hydrolase
VWGGIEAALFDLDGVLTPTAEVHRRAWSKMFNEFLLTRNQAAYTDADYFTYVDGKPRYDGVRDFLASRGIVLPEGEPSDDPAAETVCGLGNRKNVTFTEVLRTEGVAPYPGSVRLLDHLATTTIKLAVVSSSANADAVLRAAGLRDRFGVLVDGQRAAAEHLPGKPAPDTYLRGAELLGVPAAAAAVFEDAISGVAAGRSGNFGRVVGVDRGVGSAELIAAGADVVVADLEDLLP